MDAQTLAEVMGHALPATNYAELLPHYEAAAKAAEINTPARAAM